MLEMNTGRPCLTRRLSAPWPTTMTTLTLGQQNLKAQSELDPRFGPWQRSLGRAACTIDITVGEGTEGPIR